MVVEFVVAFVGMYIYISETRAGSLVGSLAGLVCIAAVFAW